MLSKFLFSTVLAAVVAPALSVALLSPAVAQSATSGANAAGDSLLLDMNQAFKRGDRKKLAQLLPQAKGHPLEPWAAYWEIKSRLGEATPEEVQDFLARYAGSYQEDRLRNDWLLLLGQRRDWTTFEVEHPQYRMATTRKCAAMRCWSITSKAAPRRLAQRPLRPRSKRTGCPSVTVMTAAPPPPRAWWAPNSSR
jgi:soluble lytic murein transglycosylase